MQYAQGLGIVIWMIGLGSMYLTRYRLPDPEKMTGPGLAMRYRQLEWVEWGYPFLRWLVIIPLLLALATVYERHKGALQARACFLFAPIFAVMPLLEGLMALRTGVYSASTRRDSLYVYDGGGKLARIARFEIVAGIAVLLAALAGFLLTPAG